MCADIGYNCRTTIVAIHRLDPVLSPWIPVDGDRHLMANPAQKLNGPSSSTTIL
jgi:hypothetical protein